MAAVEHLNRDMSPLEHLDRYVEEGILRDILHDEAARIPMIEYMDLYRRDGAEAAADSRLAAENKIVELLNTHIDNNFAKFRAERPGDDDLRQRVGLILDGFRNLVRGVPGGGYNKKYTRRTPKNKKSKSKLKKVTINNKGKRKTRMRTRLSRRARTYKGKKRR